MKAVVVIPYRGSDPWRRRAFAEAHRQAISTGLDVLVGDSGDQPFSIARTWNQLAKDAGNWDVLVRWGSDFLLEDVSQVHEAIANVRHYTLAFSEAHRQSHREAQRDEHIFRGSKAFGGVSVVTRELWQVVGGFDERFVGYGAEDYAFIRGVEIHYGPRESVEGGMCVLWHPSAKRTDDPYYRTREANLALYDKRIKGIQDPEEWAEYVDTRYLNGRENPFAQMSDDERRKWF